MPALPEWKLDAMAMMVTEPRPEDEIAAALGLDLAMVKRYLAGGNAKHL